MAHILPGTSTRQRIGSISYLDMADTDVRDAFFDAFEIKTMLAALPRRNDLKFEGQGKRSKNL